MPYRDENLRHPPGPDEYDPIGLTIFFGIAALLGAAYVIGNFHDLWNVYIAHKSGAALIVAGIAAIIAVLGLLMSGAAPRSYGSLEVIMGFAAVYGAVMLAEKQNNLAVSLLAALAGIRVMISGMKHVAVTRS